MSPRVVLVEDDRTGMDPVTLERAVLDHLIYSCSKDLSLSLIHISEPTRPY